MAHSNVCTQIRACKGTKHQKLASFAQFCYSDGSFKSGNTQEIETLLHSNISHRADDKGSNRFLKRLTPSFKTAGVFAMGATMMFSSPVFANDSANNQVAPTPVKMSTATTPTPATTVSLNIDTPQILPDAHRPANIWAVAHPDGVAISLRLGTDRSIPLKTIEQVFKNDFAGQGIDQVAFFYEQGDIPATGVAFHTDDYVYGPFSLITARKAVPKTASQMQFNSKMNLQP